MIDTGKINTEKRNPNTMNIDKLPTNEMVALMHKESKQAFDAIDDVLPEVAKAVDKIAEAFDNGGHLYYIGAGTSGRIGVLDASECPPTFGVPDTLVVGIIAGGDSALRKSSEGAEDSEENGYKEIIDRKLNENDVLVGIAASGRTPYVAGAMKAARELGAVTVSITSTPGSYIDTLADIKLSCNTGPEVVTGSTRLKSGTAQKLIVNMLSTCAMIKTGKVYENLMINVSASNEKLKTRAAGITSEILNISREEAFALLEKNNFSIREAIAAYGK